MSTLMGKKHLKFVNSQYPAPTHLERDPSNASLQSQGKTDDMLARVSNRVHYFKTSGDILLDESNINLIISI